MKMITCLTNRYFTLVLLLISTCIFSCNNPATVNKKVVKEDTKEDTLTPEQQRLPENALKGLTIANGLEVHAMATEPMLKNPTNIDVDERGRIWVTEAYNYRPAINNNPTNPK